MSADRPPKLLTPASTEERIAGCSMARSDLVVTTGYESAGSISGVGGVAVTVVSSLPRGMEREVNIQNVCTVYAEGFGLGWYSLKPVALIVRQINNQPIINLIHYF